MKLYITGGGTGGHVTPGLAIARYFEKKQPQTTVRFAGSARGIENKLVPREESYPCADLDSNLAFVWDAVRALPSKYREPIHLFYHEGYSTAEIARILGQKESTVRSLLHRGRSMLKETLKEAYDFDE